MKSPQPYRYAKYWTAITMPKASAQRVAKATRIYAADRGQRPATEKAWAYGLATIQFNSRPTIANRHRAHTNWRGAPIPIIILAQITRCQAPAGAGHEENRFCNTARLPGAPSGRAPEPNPRHARSARGLSNQSIGDDRGRRFSAAITNPGKRRGTDRQFFGTGARRISPPSISQHGARCMALAAVRRLTSRRSVRPRRCRLGMDGPVSVCPNFGDSTTLGAGTAARALQLGRRHTGGERSGGIRFSRSAAWPWRTCAQTGDYRALKRRSERRRSIAICACACAPLIAAQKD